MAPNMEPAGIITRNYDYPFPPEMHSIVRLDSYVKHQGVYNGLGHLVKESFKPRLGDVIIVKMPRVHSKKDPGFVEFFTTKHKGCHFCPGDLLLRMGKFVRRNTWRFNKRYKLYQRTDEHHWLFIGMVDNFVNLLPVTNHGNNPQHIDRHCRFFYPRRGDMIVHLQPPDRASQLEWFNPKTKITKGDILVRMYVGEPTSSSGGDLRDVVEGVVEIYMYSGKGFGWIFMGRDDCWYNDGFDLLDK